MWSHLPRYMKDKFHEVFTDGEHVPIADWQNMMRDGMNRTFATDTFRKNCFLRDSRRLTEDKLRQVLVFRERARMW